MQLFEYNRPPFSPLSLVPQCQVLKKNVVTLTSRVSSSYGEMDYIAETNSSVLWCGSHKDRKWWGWVAAGQFGSQRELKVSHKPSDQVRPLSPGLCSSSGIWMQSIAFNYRIWL